MELDKNIQNKIDKLVDESYEEFQAKNYENSFKLLFDAWDLFPEPKKNWNESFNLVTYIIDDYLKLNDLPNAEKWSVQLEEIDNNLTISKGTVFFIKGKIAFEKEAYKEARENFKESVKEGKGFRYFEDEDQKYLDFYTHPEKYIEK